VDLDERPLEMSESRTWDFSDLKALFLTCTLKRSPGPLMLYQSANRISLGSSLIRSL
jgi:hypothetical protein